MLSFCFVIILHFASMGGGGTVQATVKTTSLELCHAARRATMSAMKDADGWAGECRPLDPPEPIAAETSSPR